MSRIYKAFEDKKAFIGFLTAGDPTLGKTEEFVLEMERAGASLIEIGVRVCDFPDDPVCQILCDQVTAVDLQLGLDQAVHKTLGVRRDGGV